MTTPTQAQIEAALVAFIDAKGVFPGQRKAAIKAALTAAAQVGEPDHAAEASAYLRDKAHKHEIAATIERCAQVADAAREEAIKEYQQRKEENDFSADYYLWCRDQSDEIAAAIRKLKDAPPVDPNLIHPGKDPDFTFPEEEP